MSSLRNFVRDRSARCRPLIRGGYDQTGANRFANLGAHDDVDVEGPAVRQGAPQGFPDGRYGRHSGNEHPRPHASRRLTSPPFSQPPKHSRGVARADSTVHVAEISLATVDGIEALRNLKPLWLFDTRVSDLAPLGALQNLEELDISSLRPDSWSFLAGLRSLRILDLHGTPFEDLALLDALPSLELVRLAKTRVRKASPQVRALDAKLQQREGGVSFDDSAHWKSIAMDRLDEARAPTPPKAPKPRVKAERRYFELAGSGRFFEVFVRGCALPRRSHLGRRPRQDQGRAPQDTGEDPRLRGETLHRPGANENLRRLLPRAPARQAQGSSARSFRSSRKLSPAETELPLASSPKRPNLSCPRPPAASS